jgi:hypothetical protein
MTSVGCTVRGMVAGALGAGVAALLYVSVTFGRWSFGDPVELLRSTLNIWQLSVLMWMPIGVVAGAGLGRVAGARLVGRRGVLVAAVLGAMFVALATWPLWRVELDVHGVVAALPNLAIGVLTGGAGGLVAALSYDALIRRSPASALDAVEPATSTDAAWSWPWMALAWLLGGTVVALAPLFLFGRLPVQESSILAWITTSIAVVIAWFIVLRAAIKDPVGSWRLRGRHGAARAAVAAALIAVALTALSAMVPVGVDGSDVDPPTFTDSWPLAARGWPLWWTVDLRDAEPSRPRQLRPEALALNGLMWAILVAATVILEPAVLALRRWRA